MSEIASGGKARPRNDGMFLFSLLRSRAKSCLQTFQTFHHAKVTTVMRQKDQKVQADHLYLLAKFLVYIVEGRVIRVHLFNELFNGFIGIPKLGQQLILFRNGQARGDLIAQTRADRFVQSFREVPLLCETFLLPDLLPVTKLRNELRGVMQGRGFEIIRFARQMPEMESDGGAVPFRFPVQLYIVQTFCQLKDNFVNIFETV